MSIQAVYCDYVEFTRTHDLNDELSIDFVVPLELVSQWRRCGLVADFLAGTHALNLAYPQTALSVLSTVINELLENAVKFSKDRNKLVTISVRQTHDIVRIEVINVTNEAQAAELESFLFQLSETDAETLFFNRLESLGHLDSIHQSGVGLLTVLNDYQAGLGVKISPKPDEKLHEVSVTITIKLAVIAGLEAVARDR
jgi:hypothetical protein